MDERYEKHAVPPTDALNEIDFGALKGKSDINPQWRYEAMTDLYGLCGIGWKMEIVKTEQVPVPSTGELMVFVTISVSIRDGETWSAPIYGIGGDFLIKIANGKLKPNDEAYKMAMTDALGKALSMLGIASRVYRGLYDTKYEKRAQNAVENENNYSKGNYTREAAGTKRTDSKPSQSEKNANSSGNNRTKMITNMMKEARTKGALQNLLEFSAKYGVKQFDDITRMEQNDLTKLYSEFMTWLNPA